jgi:hypothetical protein
MAIDFLKALGLPEEIAQAENEEKALEIFQKSYIHRDLAVKDPDILSAATGKRLGSFETTLKGYLPEGFDAAAIKGKPVEDIAKTVIEHYKGEATTLSTTIKELEKGGANTEKLSQLTTELERVKNENKTLANQAKEFETALGTTKTEYEGKLKSIGINSKLADVKSKIPFAEGVSPLALKGFEAEYASKYVFDEDESGELIVLDAVKKERVARDKNAGFMTAKEALEKIAADNNLLKLSTGQPKKVTTAEPVKINGQEKRLPGNAAKLAEAYSGLKK